jgi:hypothetical protein
MAGETALSLETLQRGRVLLERIVQTRDHEPSLSPGDMADVLAALGDELCQGLRSPTVPDQQALERELRGIYYVRLLLVAWAQKLATTDDAEPTRFIKTWNDSVGRMIQLLRARRDLRQDALRQDATSWATRLLNDVQALIDRDLPELGASLAPPDAANPWPVVACEDQRLDQEG